MSLKDMLEDETDSGRVTSWETSGHLLYLGLGDWK